jgi:hypothetical protein
MSMGIYLVHFVTCLAPLTNRMHLNMTDTLQVAVANDMVRDLESKADSRERAYIQACRQRDRTMYPLRTASYLTASPSLIDRAQNRPDVEGHLRLLRKQRLMEQ